MGIALCHDGFGRDDRSIRRPHRSPNRTAHVVVRKIVHLRWRHRLSALAIASRLSIPASTVHAVLVRCRLNRLPDIDIRTGEPIRRYEHDHPGALVHVDVKKVGNIATGGGWRFVGRAEGISNRVASPAYHTQSPSRPNLGHAFVHTVIDDHSRVAYVEVHDNELANTAIVSCAARWTGFTLVASPLSACCKTMAVAISRTPGKMPALTCRLSTSGPTVSTPNQWQDQ
jgi:hypothetical protein